MVLEDIKEIHLSILFHRCQQESDLFYQRRESDPRYCFELFRRAFLLRDNTAWEGIFRLYRRQVTTWIERHPLSATLDEETEYFLNRAFEKMWSVITPAKFANFPDLKSVLRYLQLCVHSCIVDHARAREQAILLEDSVEPVSLPLNGNAEAEHLPVEQQVAQRQQARALWEWLSQRLKTQQERCVIYGVFVLALKPREVIETYRGLFRSVDEVYAVKENVLARLRRDPEAARMFGVSIERVPVVGESHSGVGSIAFRLFRI